MGVKYVLYENKFAIPPTDNANESASAALSASIPEWASSRIFVQAKKPDGNPYVYATYAQATASAKTSHSVVMSQSSFIHGGTTKTYAEGKGVNYAGSVDSGEWRYAATTGSYFVVMESGSGGLNTGQRNIVFTTLESEHQRYVAEGKINPNVEPVEPPPGSIGKAPMPPGGIQ